MENLLLPLLIVVLVLGGITMDYQYHGGATWISYVLFFGALAYVAMVVVRSIANGVKPPKGPNTMVLLLLSVGLSHGLSSCATGTDLAADTKREELTAAKAEEQFATYTFTDAESGFDKTVAGPTWK